MQHQTLPKILVSFLAAHIGLFLGCPSLSQAEAKFTLSVCQCAAMENCCVGHLSQQR